VSRPFRIPDTDAAVVGVPDAVFGEAVAAFIERSKGPLTPPPPAVEHVRILVAGYKKPKCFRRRNALR
jgi:long-chain acyl-CoA synthetase